jgi:hypothetical protein
MRTERVAPLIGILGCVAVVAAIAFPYAAVTGWGPRLGQYYSAGPFGVGATLFLALVGVVVFLGGLRGRTDPTTAAGIATALGIVTLLATLAWALSASLEPLYGFPAAWIVTHRWLVVGTSALIPVAAAAYARAVLEPG